MTIIDKFSKEIEKLTDIKLALVLGSYADNKDKNRYDEFSDLDLFIICDNPQKYLETCSWLSFFDDIICYFNDPISIGIGMELRVVFANKQLVDIAIVTEQEFIRLKQNEIFSERILGRGYKIIKNTIGTTILETNICIEKSNNILSIYRKFDEFCIDIAVIYKYLRRQDYFSAYYAFNRRIIKLLIWSIEKKAKLEGTQDIYFNGRYMSKWLDDKEIEKFNDCVLCNNVKKINKNIISSIILFRDNVIILLRHNNKTLSSQADGFLRYLESMLQ